MIERKDKFDKINNMERGNIYRPIISKIEYWRDYTGTGDCYRQQHDMDCILTNGNLLADTIISLWLPLRYALNVIGCSAWEQWKEYEAEKLRPKGLGLKDSSDFLNAFVKEIDTFLPLTDKLTHQLSELFSLGQCRCNVMILPYRSWNSRRGCRPYWDYLPHFLYDIMSTSSPVFLRAIQTWIEDEHLQMFFENGIIKRENIKDLAGTGAPWKHTPADLDLTRLLDNYISVLKGRGKIICA